MSEQFRFCRSWNTLTLEDCRILHQFSFCDWMCIHLCLCNYNGVNEQWWSEVYGVFFTSSFTFIFNSPLKRHPIGNCFSTRVVAFQRAIKKSMQKMGSKNRPIPMGRADFIIAVLSIQYMVKSTHLLVSELLVSTSHNCTSDNYADVSLCVFPCGF